MQNLGISDLQLLLLDSAGVNTTSAFERLNYKLRYLQC